MRSLAPILLACASAASSQTITGTLEGHVYDAAQGVVPNAVITARGLDTGLTRATRTNAEGYYQLGFLPLERYEITAEFSGLATTRREVTIELNVTRQADFTLKPAAVAQEVVVTDEAPLIETARGEVRGTVEQQAIEDRPLSSRNILSLVEMLPGFQSSGGYSGVNNPTLSSGSYVAFNGTGSRSVSFQIDGVNNDDSSEGSNRQNVNISTIKEFQVLTNAYSAEYGNTTGGVINVTTKSGSNEYHGNVYTFFRNTSLNANHFERNRLGQPRTRLVYNTYGGIVTGRILRDKLFGTFQRAPSEDELNQLQRNGNKRWDLGWVYTVIAGVLNLLVMYDAFAGPMFRDPPPGSEKKDDTPTPPAARYSAAAPSSIPRISVSTSHVCSPRQGAANRGPLSYPAMRNWCPSYGISPISGCCNEWK